jgi:uroporphyrin-3 C-methyltransferase
MQEPEQIENKEPETAPVKTRKRHGGLLFLSTLAMIIAVSSLVFQFFFWQLHKQAESKLAAQDAQFQATLDSSMRQMHDQLVAQRKTINELTSQTSLEGRRKSLYLFDEAEHLIVKSQYSLQYDHNIDLAIKMLTDANQKLLETNDPGVNNIRSDLTNTIVALNALPKFDTAGVIMSIAAISNQVSSLSALPVVNTQTKNVISNVKHETWQEKLMATLESLRGIVSIRRLQEPLQPMASPGLQVYLLENIRLQLAQAQWAVLHQDLTLYVTSLENAKKDLQKYYSANPTGLNLIKMLSQLQQLNIKPNVPDLSNTITSLQHYIDATTENLANTSKVTQPAAVTPSVALPPAVNAPQPSPPPTNNNAPSLPLPNTTNPIPRALPS